MAISFNSDAQKILDKYKVNQSATQTSQFSPQAEEILAKYGIGGRKKTEENQNTAASVSSLLPVPDKVQEEADRRNYAAQMQQSAHVASVLPKPEEQRTQATQNYLDTKIADVDAQIASASRKLTNATGKERRQLNRELRSLRQQKEGYAKAGAYANVVNANVGKNLASSAISNTRNIVNEIGNTLQLGLQANVQRNQQTLDILGNITGDSTYSEAADIVDNSLQKTREAGLQPIANFGRKFEESVAKENETLNAPRRTIANVAQGVGGMIPPIIANAVVPGSGLAVMSVGAAGGAYDEAKKEGADDYQAYNYGVAVGLVEALTEKIADGVAGVFGKGVADDAIESAVKNWIKYNPTAQQAVIRAFGMFGEGAEEFISEYADAFLKAAIVGTEDRDGTELLVDALQSFGIGALVGGVMQAGGYVAQNMNPKLAAQIAANNAAEHMRAYSNVTTDKDAAKIANSNRLRSDFEKVTGVSVNSAEEVKTASQQLRDAIDTAQQMEQETADFLRGEGRDIRNDVIRYAAQRMVQQSLPKPTNANINAAVASKEANNGRIINSAVEKVIADQDAMKMLGITLADVNGKSASQIREMVRERIDGLANQQSNGILNTTENKEEMFNGGEQSAGGEGRTGGLAPAEQSAGVVGIRTEEGTVREGESNGRKNLQSDYVGGVNLGIETAVGAEEDPTKTLREETNYDSDQKAIIEYGKKRGQTVRFYRGDLWVKDKPNGTPYRVRGLIHSDGKTVWVKIDHPDYSAKQIYMHEDFHAAVKSNPKVLERGIRTLKRQYANDPAGLRNLIDRYVEKYHIDATNLSDEYILEEILADAHAGIKLDTKSKSGEVTDIDSKTADRFKKAADKAVKKRTDGNSNGGSVRFSRDYNTAIDMLDDGTLNRETDSHLQILDHTPSVYVEKAGAKDRRLIIGWDIAYLAMKRSGDLPGHYHNLGKHIMKQLPSKMSDPTFAIVKPDGRVNAILEMIKPGTNRPVLVSVEFESFKTTMQEGKNDDDTYNVVVTVMDARPNYLNNLLNNKENKIVVQKEDPAHFISRLKLLANNAAMSANDHAESSSESKATTENSKSQEETSSTVGTRYSMEEDSDGRNLTEKQAEYFKDSKVRDAAGKLKVMFHGTDADFTVFNPRGRGGKNGTQEGYGIYFTDSTSVSDAYGEKTMQGYVNITHPARSDEKTITRRDLSKLIQATAGKQADEFVANGDYKTRADAIKDTWISNYTDTYSGSITSAINDVASQILTSNENDMDIVQEVMYGMAIRNYNDAYDFYDTLKGTLGIDGFITTWENRDGGSPAEIAIAFDSNQFKNVDNENPTENEDIRYSREEWQEDIDKMVEDYGKMEPGEKPYRDVTLPNKTAEDRKVSKTVRTVLEAKATPDVLVDNIEQLVAKGDFSYEVYGDEQAIKDAEKRVIGPGWINTLFDWKRDMRIGIVSKKNTSLGWALYNNAANIGNTEVAIDILNNMVEHQRNAAQALQATRILKKMEPETQLYGVARSVRNLQDELNDRYGDDKSPKLEIDQGLAEHFMKAKTEEERTKALQDIYVDIGRQMPSRFIDKVNAWRYLAMLGNPRTHIRNILGNAFFAPVVEAKNLTATGIESLVSRVAKIDRTKALVSGKGGKEILSAAWNDYANISEDALGGGKYSDLANANKYIEQGKRVFGNTKSELWNRTGGAALEGARRGNSNLLEVEDQWFSQPHYAYAMAQYCKSNGITAEQIKSGKGLEKARAYAVKEAQKATYRDTNWFSQFISGIGRNRMKSNNPGVKAIGTAVEGILPFRKTPANILVRGMEYSPLGLLKSLSADLIRVKKGSITAAEAIDNISSGLTGTGLLALGLFLASQGLIRGHGGDDEKEKAFEDLTGHQNYALELPGGASITLDWMAPEALPFFIGVNLWEQTGAVGDGVTLDTVLNSVTNVTEPLLEMSCLQSLNDLFESFQYYSSTNGFGKALWSTATSYLTQFVPTIFGQVERTLQENRMTTYTSKTGAINNTEVQRIIGGISAKIPGWDYRQIEYIDAWGRTEYSGGFVKRALNNFLNPAYMSEVEVSDMENELMRLYDATGESVFPSRADKTLTVNGQNKILSETQYVEYAKQKGTMSYAVVTSLTESKAYKGMSDADKAKSVKLAYDYANQMAKSNVVGFSADSWVTDARKAYEKYHLPISTFIAARVATSGIVSLKNKNGNGISNSKGLLRMKAIYELFPNITKQQRDFLFSSIDDIGDGIRGYTKAEVNAALSKMKRQ